MHGYGEYVYPNMTYMGFYAHDKKEGFGICYWDMFKKFVIGFWRNGKQDGPSILLKDKEKPEYEYWTDGIKTERIRNSVQDLVAIFTEKEKQFKLMAHLQILLLKKILII